MDAMQLLGSLLGNNATSSGMGNQILGQLASSLSGGGQAGYGGQSGYGGQQSAAGGGVMAVLGGLAMSALQQYMQRGPTGGAAQSPLAALAGMFGSSPAGAGAAGAGAGAGQSPLATLAGALGMGNMGGTTGPDPAQVHQQALVLVRAMINAAKADGQVDAEEQQKITAKLSDLGPEEIEFVRQEIAKPLNLDFLTQVTPAMATEVYAISLMAINLDTPAEMNYMQQLAQQLGLDAQTVNAIQQQLGINSTHA